MIATITGAARLAQLCYQRLLRRNGKFLVQLAIVPFPAILAFEIENSSFLQSQLSLRQKDAD